MGMPVSTKGGGTAVAMPDVCKIPAPPSPGVPTPFPNIVQCADATDTSEKVKISNKEVITIDSKVPSSKGDEAGTLKGVKSPTNRDQLVWKDKVDKVKVEGSAVVVHLAMTAHNGSNANAPPGKQVGPSQTKVYAG